MHLLEDVNGRRKISYGAEYFACKFAMNLLYNKSVERDVNCINKQYRFIVWQASDFNLLGLLAYVDIEIQFSGCKNCHMKRQKVFFSI